MQNDDERSSNISRIQEMAAEGRLVELPPELLTLENLTAVIDGHGTTALHIAAENGFLGQIPSSILNSEAMKIGDLEGNTPIHEAARSGNFGSLPKQFQSPNWVLLQNKHGQTPLHVAAQYQQLVSIPEDLISFHLAKGVVDDDKCNLLHLAAEISDIYQVPPHIFQIGYVNAQDIRGNNVLMLAATHDCFRDIPERCITEEGLLASNKEGTRVIDHIAGSNLIEHVPPHLCTMKVLGPPNEKFLAPGQLIMMQGYLHLLPKNMFPFLTIPLEFQHHVLDTIMEIVESNFIKLIDDSLFETHADAPAEGEDSLGDFNEQKDYKFARLTSDERWRTGLILFRGQAQLVLFKEKGVVNIGILSGSAIIIQEKFVHTGLIPTKIDVEKAVSHLITETLEWIHRLSFVPIQYLPGWIFPVVRLTIELTTSIDVPPKITGIMI